MKWQCALLKRWLPEYPDGDLPAWGKRWLGSHLPGCPACRRELAEFRQVIAAVAATPVVDPGPEFWGEFSRDLHLKLAQAAQEGQASPIPTGRGWLRLPYLLGAPALAALLLYVAVQFTAPGAPIRDQAKVAHLPASPLAQKQSEVAHSPAPPPAPDQAMVTRGGSAAKMAAAPRKSAPQAEVPTPATLPVETVEEFVTVALEEGTPLPQDDGDITDWDLDAELAGMTDQEKNIFLNKMHQRKKDGSCVEGFSFYSWG